MTTGLFRVPAPRNEPVHTYTPGSFERAALQERVRAMEKERIEARHVIAGAEVAGSGTFALRAPHRHDLHLADVHSLAATHVGQAIDAALAAARDWAAMPWEERAAIMLKAADLIAGPWRDTLNAATILGQSKSVQQAEIDAACELIDFLRFNAYYAQRLYSEQPDSAPGMWNRMDHRPLEGFVLAITPFNFTAIAGNLPTAPALMGNVVVWKPSEKQALAAYYTMQILEEAGLPPGVINLVHGDGATAAEVCTRHRAFAGLHFTGSTTVLRGLWRTIGERNEGFRSYPRVVGESGGKDFVIAHPSADADALVVALGRGAFEYQGQKCSAASRAYVPRSLWPAVRDGVADLARDMKRSMGDVGDLSTFMGAVISEQAFAKHADALERARADGVQVLAGGHTDSTVGWFVDPTVLVTQDARSDTMVRELFGPILTCYVYDDADWEQALGLVDSTSDYALTGSVFAQDRGAVAAALDALRNAAGNVYVNDKPTGSVVGQQPFGGARGSGTNDKAGSVLNLVRWVSPRTVKETFAPAYDWRYPHMG
jgi:1-pyrroline-5-carboxylate dehydrogenase